ncbi:MAG TPA: ferredoxin [Catalimonadaceae bacterium]|nr:ferredoxin [Catalimonadaceae bacterium]
MPNLIQYRKRCIGCGVCHDMQPELWRMSKKDGKATLILSVLKKETHVLPIPEFQRIRSEEVAVACPVNIIKVI